MAELTFYGLWSYKDDLFDLVQVPAPPTADSLGVQAEQIRQTWTINRDDLFTYLCFRSMGFSLSVPDGDFLKLMLGTFSRIRLPMWQRYFDTFFYKYNPLWNKDGTHTGRSTGTSSQTDTTGRSASTSSESETETTTDATTTSFVHGYDNNTVTPDPSSGDGLGWTHSDKGVSEGTNNQTGTASATTSESGTLSRQVTDSGTDSWTEQGNIGLTMTQQLIEAERKLAMDDIYAFIIDDFIKNFCVMVY